SCSAWPGGWWAARPSPGRGRARGPRPRGASPPRAALPRRPSTPEGRLARAALGVGGQVAAGVLDEELDLPLRLFQLGVAQAGEAHAFLVQGQRFLESQLALLQPLDDLLE